MTADRIESTPPVWVATLAGLVAVFARLHSGVPPPEVLSRAGLGQPSYGRGFDTYAPLAGKLVKPFIRPYLYQRYFNVMEDPVAQGVRVCPIDGEMAARGPGLIDLAALTGGSWPEPGRQAIVQAYRDAHLDFGDQSLSERDFDVALDFCRLQLAIQWLGWSATWQAPSAQAHDWLGDALGAADRLGL